MLILITGVAGFIGSHLVKAIYKHYENPKVIGIDNLNNYYDVKLKESRLLELKTHSNFIFIQGDISDKNIINKIFVEYKPTIVINLAAQAGVRYSITNPDVYINTNIVGFYNILEACRHSYKQYNGVEHLIYASSSSVYGSNNKIPYSINDKTDNPVSLYAATKKSNELMAQAYSKLYNIPSTGLRLFTVYGPMGRPDMAYFDFTNKLVKNEKIQIFNYGNCKRDFTYIDDVISSILCVIDNPPAKQNGSDGLPISPHKIYNIGNNSPESIIDFVNILKDELVSSGLISQDYNLNEHIDLLPMQQGDVNITYADTSDFENKFNFKPFTNLREGIHKFVNWYKEYYN